MGVYWFRPEIETKNACRGWSAGLVKSRPKTDAEDNTADILAEAEYIFNNADEFLAGVEAEEYEFAA